MPRKYTRIPDSPFAAAENLSLSLAVDSQLTVLKGRMITLLDRYQQMRAEALKALNYFDTDGLRKMDIARCPTLYATKTEGTPNRTCQRYTFCPFCWARLMAGECYRKFERVLFGDNRGTRSNSVRRRDHANFTLFEYSEELWVEDEITAAVKNEAHNLTYHKTWFTAATGVFYLTTVEPSATRLRIRPRLLAIVDSSLHDQQLPEEMDGVVIRRRWDNPDRMMLAQAVGRTCEYPLGLLKGPHDLTLEILRARSGGRGTVPRLSIYHGELRGKTVRTKKG